MDVYTIINNEWSKSEVLSVAESFVRLEHVFYKYEDTEKYAVKDVSISAQKGNGLHLLVIMVQVNLPLRNYSTDCFFQKMV